MNTLRSQLALFALILVTAPLSSAAASDEAKRYPPLTAYGNTYVNSCSPIGRSELRASLYKGKIADPAQLWKVIDTLLCAAPTPTTKRYIAGVMASKVSDSNEGTGQDPHYAVIERSTDFAGLLLAFASAWDATIDFIGNDVSLSYHSDEVCVTSRKFRYTKSRWRIYAVGQGCD